MPISRSRLSLAIVGCGAVVERMYLPVLRKQPRFRVECLADPDASRLDQLASKFSVPRTTASWEELTSSATLMDSVDAVLICLPHAMHMVAAMSCLTNGKHVLCDKPMAVSASECESMIQAARSNNVTLSVPLVRRFYAKNNLIQHLLRSELLGRIQSFDFVEGFDFRWPTVSGFSFNRTLSGGGVLMDTGAHTLDTIRWWFGLPGRFEYFDDNHGGVEASCEIRMVYESGLHGRIRLSRIDPLGERYVIRGSRATLITGSDHASPVTLEYGTFAMSCFPAQHGSTSAPQTFDDAVDALFDDFAEACQTGRHPQVLASEAAEVVSWIEQCYRARRALRRPWETVSAELCA